MRRAALPIALLLAALATLSTGCRTVPRAVPLPPDDARPRDYLRTVVEGAQQLHSLRGRARLAVDNADGSVHIRASQILVLERPAQLRVEVLGLLSQTALVLASDGSEYQLFVPGDGSYQSGPVYPGLLREVSGISLPPDVVVDLVLGSSIPDEDLILTEAAATSDGEIQVALSDAAGRLRRRMAFDDRGHLRRLEAHRDGRLLWGARFERYEPVEGRPFAHEIVLEVPDGESRAELSLSDVELNPPLSADVFRLNLPRFQGRVPQPSGEGGG